MKCLYIRNRILLLFAVSLAIASCQKVIVLPIDEQDNLIIFEGVLKNRDGASYFNLSRSVGIYDSEDAITAISDATIDVFDTQGNQFQFTEDPAHPGTYINHSFVAQPNTTYSMTAIIGGEVITGVSFTKSKPIIDSLYTKPNPFDLEPPFSQWVYYHSSDPVDEENYYRLRIWRNGKEPSLYYIGNDYYINGQAYEAQFFGVDALPGDSIFIEMQEMDPDVYDYIYGLSNALTTGPFSPAPSNPPSNLTGNAVGYFGVYMTDTMSMVVQ
jgi:hypothetical protein